VIASTGTQPLESVEKIANCVAQLFDFPPWISSSAMAACLRENVQSGGMNRGL
jgi:hypothetical protein